MVWKGRPQEGIIVTLSKITRQTLDAMRDDVNGNFTGADLHKAKDIFLT